VWQKTEHRFRDASIPGTGNWKLGMSWDAPSLLQTEHKRLLHIEMLFQIESCMLHGGITIHIASRWRFTIGVGDGFWAKTKPPTSAPELNFHSGLSRALGAAVLATSPG
jgi:hypothetical protein